jgi:pyruvate,water dikinase
LGRDLIQIAVTGLIAAVTNQPTVSSPLKTAGERLFIDITGAMRHGQFRRLTAAIPPLVEPGSAQVLAPLWADPALAPDGRRLCPRTILRLAPFLAPIAGRFLATLLWPDWGRRRAQRRIEEAVAALEARCRVIEATPNRLAAWADAIGGMAVSAFRFVLPHLLPAFAPGMATLNLLTHLAADAPDGRTLPLEITRGLPHNVTTEMDLALWQVAQAIRSDPTARQAFQTARPEKLALADLPPAAQAAVQGFLARYGMRGVGEIDIGRPRWREDPTPIIRAIASYLQIDQADRAPDAVFARGAASAAAATERLAAAVRPLRHGWLRARQVRWAARRVRSLAGLRESPKFTIIRFFGIVREGLLACGRELATSGALAQPDDVFFLTLDELRALSRGALPDAAARATERRQANAREARRRQIPRILLSDGRAFYEGVALAEGEAPGALAGSPVSPGVVEGAVRVVFAPHAAQLAPGEILVCPGTDPAWTPLFLAAGGLVMEVGGLMTHGAVVAREYGIPAVVGVSQATLRLKTGQRVRVDGSTGRITLLDGAA